MSDVKKSALWALISVPISIFGFVFSWGLLHNGGIYLLPYTPAVLAMLALDLFKETPEWLVTVVLSAAQYLGYSLFIFVWIKIYKALKKTRAENIAQEQFEKDD